MTDQLCVLEHRTDPDRPRHAVPGLLLCIGHGDRLFHNLDDLPELRDALTEQMGRPWRETVSDDPTPLAIPEKPLPLQPHILELRELMDSRVGYYARETARFVGNGPPPVGLDRTAPWLRDRLHIACAQDWTRDLAEGIEELARDARRALDRPTRTYLFLGPCTCGQALYAPASARNDVVICTVCGNEHSKDERRTWVIQAMENHLVTAEQGAVFAGAYHQRTISPKTVTSWHRRGQIERRGERGRAALYRLGDIVGTAWIHNTDRTPTMIA